jgi:hypothetical protein
MRKKHEDIVKKHTNKLIQLLNCQRKGLNKCPCRNIVQWRKLKKSLINEFRVQKFCLAILVSMAEI